MVSGERLEGSKGGRKVEFIMSQKERGEEMEEGRAYVAEKGLRMSQKEGADENDEGREGGRERGEEGGEEFMWRMESEGGEECMLLKEGGQERREVRGEILQRGGKGVVYVAEERMAVGRAYVAEGEGVYVAEEGERV